MRSRAGTLERTPQPIAVRSEVIVTEEGIRPWTGTATAVKWSSVSGWWIEIRTDRGTWIMPERHVAELAQEEGAA